MVAGIVGFILLAAAGVAAILGRGPVWWITLLASVIVGVFAGVVTLVGVLSLSVCALACSSYAAVTWREGARPILRVGAFLAVATCLVLLGFHLAPGFENIPVLQQVVLKQDAAPFSLWLNFDKTAAGVLVAGFCYRRRRERALQIRRSLLSTILMACVIAACLLVPATICAYVRWNPSWNPLFLVWAPINLFLVCMSEEAFFRGFLQAEVVPELPAGAGPIIGVVLSGTLFGLAHIAGGWTYVTLAAAAGIGYATVFQFTRRLEYSILAHWMTNSIHFVLFTYPALAAAAPR